MTERYCFDLREKRHVQHADGAWVRYEDHLSALTAERSQREGAERKLADMTAEPLCLLSDYAAMRAERDTLTAALAVATKELETLRNEILDADLERSFYDR